MSPPTASEVMAVILTFNAPSSLSRCIEAVASQSPPPGGLLVVDNHSDRPAVVPSLPGIDLRLLRTDDNGGPAGGHAVGLATFLDSRCRYAWVMDDDCVPRPGCLGALLDVAAGVEDVLVFPEWFDVAEGRVRNYPAWNGFLVSREVVARLGLPRSDFVWWAEDTEYLQWRTHLAGIASARADEAVVDHVRVRVTADRPAWKVYYEVRNTVYFRLWVQRRPFRRFKRMGKTLARTAAQIAWRDGHKGRKAVMYLRGVFDGLSGRMGKRVALGAREVPTSE